MHETMENSAGIFRDETSLKQACDTLSELSDRFQDVAIDDHTLSFNTELTAALELGYMLDVAQTLVHAALARRESRGSHQRTDHSERDDEQFLKHSMATFDPAAPSTPRIDYKPVTITKWPPGKRTYGADSGLKTNTGETPP
jgi:fumarate reductase flavoprotein subunit